VSPTAPALLDVNLLVALFDPDHVHHDPAHDWFVDSREQGWATCPVTENGVIRILSNLRYSPAAESPARTVKRLQGRTEGSRRSHAAAQPRVPRNRRWIHRLSGAWGGRGGLTKKALGLGCSNQGQESGTIFKHLVF